MGNWLGFEGPLAWIIEGRWANGPFPLESLGCSVVPICPYLVSVAPLWVLYNIFTCALGLWVLYMAMSILYPYNRAVTTERFAQHPHIKGLWGNAGMSISTHRPIEAQRASEML